MKKKPLYVVLNDLIGGVAVAHVDAPLSEIDRRNNYDLVVADMIREDYAKELVRLWNAALDGGESR